MPEHDLIVVGAGAKAAGIATKVHVVNRLGLAELSVLIVESTEVAASWKGRNGMTSGEEPLAVTPIKDVGFPYQSHVEFGEAGEAIDAALAEFTWQQHMISLRRYARWVDAGSPPVRHRDYGEYLSWVLSRASEGVAHLGARVTQVKLDEAGERWLVEAEEDGGTSTHTGRAIVLTGPGIHRAFPHEPAVAGRVFHCDSRREEFERIPAGERRDVAIVGGGESALSATMFLRGMRPECRFTIYTPMLPMSRGESFLENRVFSNPDAVEWRSLDERTRRDFVKHSDRGVFDPPSLAAIAYDERCRFVVGRVVDVGAGAGEGCGSSSRPRRGRRAPSTTSSPTAPASTCWRSCARSSRRAPARRSSASAGRSGTARPAPRCRSAAPSSCATCGRACTYPASPGSARARASPTSAPSACSPTGSCSRI